MSETIIMLLAHGKRQDIFDLTLPEWERFGMPIIVCCPSDSSVNAYGHETFYSGVSSFNGPLAVHRLKNVLNRFVVSRSRFVVLAEYDSICLAKTLPKLFRGLHGIVSSPSKSKWVLSELRRFQCLRYAMSPWTIDCDSAAAMLCSASRFPDVQEEGADDRVLSAWAEIAGIPVISHADPGYSENRIRIRDYWTLRKMIRKNGCRWVHGIKDQRTFNLIRKWNNA